jgi:hypothetical protein
MKERSNTIFIKYLFEQQVRINTESTQRKTITKSIE